MLEELKELLKSEKGTDLKMFLINEMEKMKDIDNIKDYSDAKTYAIEIKSQKKAYEKIKNILSLLEIIEKTKDISKKDIKDRFYNIQKGFKMTLDEEVKDEEVNIPIVPVEKIIEEEIIEEEPKE